MHAPIKIQRDIKILSQIKSLKCISISGSFVTGDFKDSSDYDIFCICVPGRIWTTRFLVQLFLILAGKIAREKNHAGKICPNHFITTDGLRLQQQNEYTANLFSKAFSVYDPNGIWGHFQAANKEWIKAYGYNYLDEKRVDSVLIQNSKKGCIGDLFEKMVEKIQRWKIAQNPLTRLPKAQIILSDKELRFHPRPKSIPTQ